jgi:hypothetical protein
MADATREGIDSKVIREAAQLIRDKTGGRVLAPKLLTSRAPTTASGNPGWGECLEW